ncbi:MAG: large conductance mechanosensitive channel protein MscL [Dehalococcoidia bacterium]|nr:large conductance mechanosensitive channel protein MscL [Dehalococcoidia bacterium]
MKKVFTEFKEFALKSNIIALAIGIIIGGALQGVVASLTNNILSPILGIFVGSNFDRLVLNVLGTTIMYGAFITSLINFLIMAVVVFLMIKGMNKLISLTKKQEPAPQPVHTCPYCKTEINTEATRCPACTSQLAPNP